MATVGTPTRVAIQNILLATDFSTFSDAALPYAAGFAKRYGSTLFIVTVLAGVYDFLPAHPSRMEQDAQRRLEFLLGSSIFEGIEQKGIVGRGDVFPVLQELIRQNRIDLVILGTHGRKGFERLVLGSVAEDVFRHTTCPVLTVGPLVKPNSHPSELRHVLFATSFGEETKHGLPYALSIAEEHQAKFTLLHAVPGQESDIGEKLVTMMPPDANLKIRPEFIVKTGDPAETIVATAAEIDADLIVMGVHRTAAVATHGARGTAYKVVCQAHCPVLTVGADIKI